MGIVLGIESSCDETAVALVSSDRTIIAERIASQIEEHAPYGGVVPEIAARAHAQKLAPMIAQVLDESGVGLRDCAAIAATAGPGLIGGVMVGLVSAKALAMASDVPLIAINHLEGHALSPRLADPTLAFPYLLLLVSGGHCQILRVGGVGHYRRLATTIDDALGEAYDKTAKILGLGYPGGPAVERLALEGDAGAVPLPRPLKGSPRTAFLFRRAQKRSHAREAERRSSRRGYRGCVSAGGDRLPDRPARTGDRRLWHGPRAGRRRRRSGQRPHPTCAAEPRRAGTPCASLRRRWRLCTDNAAMIAWAGAERLALGQSDPLDFVARPRWPLDPDAEPVRGAGAKA